MSLPVRSLVLYKHGVALLERRGAVEGESVTLSIRSEQMNDLLKSLVALDFGDGHVRAIAFDAHGDAERRLGSLSISLSERESLVDLLGDLRGRRVRLHLAGERVLEGKVVGLDLPDRKPNRRGRLSVLGENGVEVVGLRALERVELLDERAAQDLDEFLTQSLAEPTERRVTVRLSEGSHDLSLRYLIPAPTWRVSYRLVGEVGEDGERIALLQGWGIFDSPLDEPLEEVALTLVAGRPVSFIYDLYAPYTPERPVIHEGPRAPAPPVTFGLAAEGSMPESAPRDLAAKRARIATLADMDAYAGSAPVVAEAEAQDERFAYRIAEPVSVGRGEAAMVPILATRLPYRRELMYRAAERPEHPSVVLRFSNDSTLTLERGPIAVSERGEYAGEAIFPFTRPGANVILAIALEPGVRIGQERLTTRETHRISFHKDALFFDEYVTQMTTYAGTNQNPEPQSVVIEHPRLPNHVLVGTATPEEEGDGFARWRIELPAGPEGRAELEVRERQLVRRRATIDALDYDSIRQYIANRWLDEALAGPLRALLELHDAKRTLAHRLVEIEQERNRLTGIQEQARKNMSGLRESGEEGALRARYVRQLGESEDALARLEEERVQATEAQAALDARIAQQLAALNRDGGTTNEESE